MLTGCKAFEGKTPASLIGAILRDTPPPVSTQRPVVSPASLDHVVRKCLEKNPEARWHSAHDLHDQLGGLPPTDRRSQWLGHIGGATGPAGSLDHSILSFWVKFSVKAAAQLATEQGRRDGSQRFSFWRGYAPDPRGSASPGRID